MKWSISRCKTSRHVSPFSFSLLSLRYAQLTFACVSALFPLFLHATHHLNPQPPTPIAQYNLHPTFTSTDVARLETNRTYTHALDGTDYLPGTVGLNNIKNTDWLNVVVQALVRVTPLREFFIIEKNWEKSVRLDRCHLSL